MKKLTYIISSFALILLYSCGNGEKEGKIDFDGKKEPVIEESRKTDSTRYDNPGNKNDPASSGVTDPAHNYDDTVSNNKRTKTSK
jgi:hypothetical protein